MGILEERIKESLGIIIDSYKSIKREASKFINKEPMVLGDKEEQNPNKQYLDDYANGFTAFFKGNDGNFYEIRIHKK